MTKNEMNTLAASAANDWCRCFKCDRIVNETGLQCVKPCGTCTKWFDGYKTAMIALEKLEKQRESLHIPETCKENADSFTDARKDVIVAIEIYLDWLTGYPDYAPKGKYSIRDMLHCLFILEKQKEQKVDIDKLRRDLYQSGYNDGYQHGKEDAQKEQKPAEWSEEQMLKEAVEGRIHYLGFRKAVYIKDPEWTDMLDKYEEGDKVRVIVLPMEEEEK